MRYSAASPHMHDDIVDPQAKNFAAPAWGLDSFSLGTGRAWQCADGSCAYSTNQ